MTLIQPPTGVDGLEANQGARTIPNNWYSGMIWDTTKDEWRDSNVSDLEDVEQLRFETQVTHDRLNFLRETLERLGPWYPQADVELVHEYLVFAHRGIRGVVLSTHADVTFDRKIAFLKKTRLGPDFSYVPDLTLTGEDALLHYAADFFSYIDANRAMVLTPDDRLVWVNPSRRRS